MQPPIPDLSWEGAFIALFLKKVLCVILAFKDPKKMIAPATQASFSKKRELYMITSNVSDEELLIILSAEPAEEFSPLKRLPLIKQLDCSKVAPSLNSPYSDVKFESMSVIF